MKVKSKTLMRLTRADDPKNDGRVFRASEIEVEHAEGQEAVVRVSVSSETPYPRFMRDPETQDWVRCLEVLGHKAEEIDDSRMRDGLVIQDTHWGDQVGLIRKPEIKDGKIRGVIEFCSGARAKEIESDAKKGLRRNMSVGYIVNEYERAGVDEKTKLPIFRVTKWTPYEASFVNVPADTNVGVDRVADPQTETKGAAVDTPAATKENKENKAMTPEQIAALYAKAERAHMKNADVQKLIGENKTYEQCLDIIAERACAYADELAAKTVTVKTVDPAKPGDTAKPEKPQTVREIFDAGDEKQIVKRYNIMNVFRALAHEGTADVGFEREVSDEIAKANNKEARGFYVPESVFVNAMRYHRAMTGKTNVSGHIDGNGAALVSSDLLSAYYIDELVATTILGAAGVGTVNGLVGDILLPKGTAVTADWIAEKDKSTRKTPTFSQVPGTPHTCAANAVLSRKLMLQSSIGVQALVTRLILEAIGRAVEAATFDGTGSNNQPTGLSKTSGVQSVSMTADKPTMANMVEFWEKVYTANANGGSMKYIGSPAVKALLRKTRDFTAVKNVAGTENVGGVGGEFLCTKDGQIEGYDFIMSGLCDAKKLYFGNWNEILMAFWSGIDVTVDPYTLSDQGAWRVSAFQDADVIVRHPEAFAIGTARS